MLLEAKLAPLSRFRVSWCQRLWIINRGTMSPALHMQAVQLATVQPLLRYRTLDFIFCIAVQAVQHHVQDTQPAVHAAHHHPHPQPGPGLQPECAAGYACLCALVQGAHATQNLLRSPLSVAIYLMQLPAAHMFNYPIQSPTLSVCHNPKETKHLAHLSWQSATCMSFCHSMFL